MPKREKPGLDNFFFDCAITDEDGEMLTNQRMSGNNFTRDLVTGVAVVLGRPPTTS